MNPLNGIQDVSPLKVEPPDVTVAEQSEAVSPPSSSIFTWLIKPDVIKDNLNKVSQQVGDVIATPKMPDAENLKKVTVIVASGLAVGMMVRFIRQSRPTDHPDEVTE